MRCRLACAAALLALCGCVSPELAKIGYDGKATRTSNKSATLNMASGAVEVVDTATLNAAPALHFNLDDQRMFAVSLRDELNRLKLVRVGGVFWEEQGPAADVSIAITFQRTRYVPLAQRYFLDVAMQLKSGDRSFARRYQVYSAEGEGFWARINTDASEGKALAAKKLMARLIPDIEAFVAGLD
jgi:hypothetical protein